MSTEVIFYISVKNANIHVIADKLKNLDLNVFPWEIGDVGKKAFDPTSLADSVLYFHQCVFHLLSCVSSSCHSYIAQVDV
jgi:hypothetical protein